MKSQSSNSLYNPGQDNGPAGTYQEVGPRGGKIPQARTCRISRGDRLPPVQESGNKWAKQ